METDKLALQNCSVYQPLYLTSPCCYLVDTAARDPGTGVGLGVTEDERLKDDRSLGKS